MKPSTVAPIGCFGVKNYPMGLFGWHYLVFHWLLRVARETWSKFPPQNIPMVQHRPNLKPIERRSVTSHSHGSKFSGSLQSFLTETVKVRLNDWRKVWATVLFLRAVIHVSFLVFFLPYVQYYSLLRSRKFCYHRKLTKRLFLSISALASRVSKGNCRRLLAGQRLQITLW